MKSISLDFKNYCVCIMSEGQQGTMFEPDLKIEDFYDFIPKQYRDRTSYTWNFEAEIFSINYDYTLEPSAIMTQDCFIPSCILPMKGLKKQYPAFIKKLGYEETILKNDIPKDLRKFLGLE